MPSRSGNLVDIQLISRALLFLGLFLAVFYAQLGTIYASTLVFCTTLFLSLAAPRMYGFAPVISNLCPVSTGPSTIATIYLNKFSYKEPSI